MSAILPFLLSILVASTAESSYQDAEKQASLALSAQHDAKDSLLTCNGQMTAVSVKDSVMNGPGAVGSQYSYPIYKYETGVLYYKNKKIAALEKKQIELQAHSYKGVITGVDIIIHVDPMNSFYFDEDQQPITQEQLTELKDKLCEDTSDGY